jgi:hypothetical protein
VVRGKTGRAGVALLTGTGAGVGGTGSGGTGIDGVGTTGAVAASSVTGSSSGLSGAAASMTVSEMIDTGTALSTFSGSRVNPSRP